MKRLRERRLLKEVFREPLKKCDKDPNFPEEMLKKDKAGGDFVHLQRKLAEACGIDREYLAFVEVWPQRGPRKPSPEPTIDTENIFVVNERNEHESYDRVSQFFRHVELSGDDLLCIYMPIDDIAREAKKRKYKELRDRVCDVVGFSDTEGPSSNDQKE